MCRVLEVAVSGYDWLKQPVANHAQEDARLLRLIRASVVASRGIYGAPRVFLDLHEMERPAESIASHAHAREPFAGAPWLSHPALVGQHTLRSDPSLLRRRFTVTRPNTAWMTEIN
jgi:putative transposase